MADEMKMMGTMMMAVMMVAIIDLMFGKGVSEGDNAGLTLSITDTDGNPVSPSLVLPSAFDLHEGEAYTVHVGVTNLSVQDGNYVAATLVVPIIVSLSSVDIASTTFGPISFGPNETKVIDLDFIMPSDSAGQTGYIWARVIDPDGNQLAADTEPIDSVSVSLNGSITQFLAFIEGMPDWVQMTPGSYVAKDKDVNIAVGWVNNCLVPFAGNVELKVTYPNSATSFLPAVSNQNATAGPDEGWTVQFGSFNTSQVGIYNLRATLRTGGIELDVSSMDFLVEQTIQYGAGITIGVD